MNAAVLEIRPIAPNENDAWRALWTAYLAFYETSVAEDVYRTTWARLHESGEYEPKGLFAVSGGEPVGLCHFMYQRHCWHTRNVCYLQDLYAIPRMRGKGIGGALIKAVYARADKDDCANVYWMTQDFNTQARKLYDHIGKRTPFIKYQR